MFKVLFITFLGIGLGYLLRSASWVKYLPKGITYTIWMLLFFFGLQVGANDLVVSSLDTLGLKALAIAVAGVLGSSAAAWLVYKTVFKGNDNFVKGESDSSLPESLQEGFSPAPTSSMAYSLAETDGEDVDQLSGSRYKGLLGGFVIAGFFALGCLCGWMQVFPQDEYFGEIAMYVLYALMVQVGMSIGSDARLKEILLGLNPKLLFLPLGTIVGTLFFAALVPLFISGIPLADCMAVGAGFGYYSLSSLLITQIKEAAVGADMAAQLGTIALMSNIMREVMTLLLSPVICKVFGKLAPISSGGATSMDSTLPVITAVCGKELVFISIFHGVLVDFSVPFLVTFFASM